MSYGYFAEFYDSFTDDVNYDKIEKFVCSLLSREGINGGLLLDLACGTGSLAVRLSEKGYSVIGTDMSPEMLSVAQQKAAVKNADILFLCQDMTQLNLYGTIICTVCTLDFFAEADNGLYERYSESFSECAYELCDIEDALTEAGFEIIGIYDGYDNSPISDNSQRAVFAARKGKNNG